MQSDLFEDAPAPPPGALVDAAGHDAALRELALRLQRRFGTRLRLGTSSWHFPGWAGLVWGRAHTEATLSRHGLHAYAQHPLFGGVGLDRSFYRPLDAAGYQALAVQVGPDFRFVVKALAQLTDATIREPGSARPLQPNSYFLDAHTALAACVQPAVLGLGERLGVLVFQLSPLPGWWLAARSALLVRLGALLGAVRAALPPAVVLAVEVRDAALLAEDFAALLRAHGARPVLGLHDRLPPPAAQAQFLRAAGDGDLVCRWSLQRGLRYEEAKERWAPFDRLQAPDPATRAALARLTLATLAAGHRVFVTINNKAEGSAPLSVRALAEALDAA